MIPLAEEGRTPSYSHERRAPHIASLLIQQGESLTYVKEQMGHHSIQITVDSYGHLLLEGSWQDVDKLDELETATIRNLDAIVDLNAVSMRGRSS